MSVKGQLPSLKFKLTVLQNYRSVYQMAAALLGDTMEAEDVTQETFTRYWQEGDSIEQPKHWLMRVARNNCIDRIRRSARIQYRENDEMPILSDDCDAALQLENEEQEATLRKGIAALPEPQRSIVILFGIRGMSGADCARVLDLSTNQVKVYLHRARQRLARFMEEHA
jgi:RNA polymerase sigma-70 factor, ECF subfamily